MFSQFAAQWNLRLVPAWKDLTVVLPLLIFLLAVALRIRLYLSTYTVIRHARPRWAVVWRERCSLALNVLPGLFALWGVVGALCASSLIVGKSPGHRVTALALESFRWRICFVGAGLSLASAIINVIWSAERLYARAFGRDAESEFGDDNEMLINARASSIPVSHLDRANNARAWATELEEGSSGVDILRIRFECVNALREKAIRDRNAGISPAATWSEEITRRTHELETVEQELRNEAETKSSPPLRRQR